MSFGDSLRALADSGAAVWGFLLALGIVLILTPVTQWLAPRIGAVDIGGDRARIHKGAIPRIGGIAIVVAVAVATGFYVHIRGPYRGIIIGTALVAMLGLYDDIRGVKPSVKLLGVTLIALIPVVHYGVRLHHFTLPFIGNHDLSWVAYPLTVIWIVALANLVNLIDGMDALAAGIVSIAALSFAVLAASFGRMNAAVEASIVCGATLGFLRHNYHPAKIFMGDTGALALGFLLACVAVEGLFKTAATITLVAPFVIMAVPILDTSFVILKRLKYRRAPWGADHNHFYHRFLRIGLTQRRTAAYLHLWAGLLAAYALLLRFVPPRPGGRWDGSHALLLGVVGLGVLAASAWMVYSLEILKARHLQALRLRRAPGEPDEDHDEAIEQLVSAGSD